MARPVNVPPADEWPDDDTAREYEELSEELDLDALAPSHGDEGEEPPVAPRKAPPPGSAELESTEDRVTRRLEGLEGEEGAVESEELPDDVIARESERLGP